MGGCLGVPACRLENLRITAEAQLRAKEEAMEALRADTTSRLEEARALTNGLHKQLRDRQEEVERLNTRAGEQVSATGCV